MVQVCNIQFIKKPRVNGVCNFQIKRQLSGPTMQQTQSATIWALIYGIREACI